MNVNSLQEAIRERDEARAEYVAECEEHRATAAHGAAAIQALDAQLSEALALLRRYRWFQPAGVIANYSNAVDVDADAFLSRLDARSYCS